MQGRRKVCTNRPARTDTSCRAHSYPETEGQQAVCAAREGSAAYLKGQGRGLYEFGVKVGVAITHKQALIVLPVQHIQYVPGFPPIRRPAYAGLESEPARAKLRGSPRRDVLDVGGAHPGRQFAS